MRSCFLYAGLALALASPAAQAQNIPCIDVNDSSAYGCLNLLRPFAGIRIVTEQDGSGPKLYRYGSINPGAPVDYNFHAVSCNAVTESCDETGDALFFTVTYPENYDYAHCPALPCIAFFHAGGFKEAGSGTGMGSNDIVTALAERGYVVFNVQYRTGWNLCTQPPQVNYNPPSQVLAAYRGFQDIRGALRSIRKMQADGRFSGSPYRFDISHLYLAGASAGAFQCINAAYMDQQESQYAFPNVRLVLGPLDSPLRGYYYYGTAAAPLPVIRGVLSMWGAGSAQAGANPNRAVFVDDPNGDGDPGDIPPFIGFHGQKDVVAPYLSRAEYFTRDTVIQCSGAQQLRYFVPAQTAATGNMAYGSLAIYNRLKVLGVPAEVYLDSDMAHGLGPASDFGISNPTQARLIEYIAGRAATFFQSVISGREQSLTHTQFADRENCRYGMQSDTPDPCTNPSDPCAGTAAKGVAAAPAERSPELRVQPNPAADRFTVSLSDHRAVAAVRVYDAYGRLVFAGQSGGASLTIPRNALSPAAAGWYMVEVVSGSAVFRSRLVLE